MIFNKKRNQMIDIRELQKRGVVRIPKKEITIPTDDNGFVELKQNQPAKQSNTDFFGFTNITKPTPQPETFSTESEGYNKRQVDTKISDLDNKIYKLEQRIELLERKLDVNQPSNVGAMGW
ncbi:MAG: hypothetical protein V1888_03865 [archaeon]